MPRGTTPEGMPWAELDVTVGGDPYVIRATLVSSRTVEGGSVVVHVDYQNQTTLASGRYENVELNPRNVAEAHRACLRRNMIRYAANNTPVASPVFT